MSAVREALVRLMLDMIGVQEKIQQTKEQLKTASQDTREELILQSVNFMPVRASVSSLAADLKGVRDSGKMAAGSLSSTFADVPGPISGVGQAIGATKGALSAVGSRAGDSLKSLIGRSSGFVDDLLSLQGAKKAAIEAVAAIAIGTVVASTYTAADVNGKIEAIGSNIGPEGKAQFEEWVRMARKQRGVSESQRADESLAAAQFFKGMDADKQTKFLGYLEKEMIREIGSTDSIAEIIQLIGLGQLDSRQKETMKRRLPGLRALGIDIDRIQAEAEDKAAWSGRSVDEVAINLFINKFIEAAETKKIDALGATLAEANIPSDTLDQLKEALSDIMITIGQYYIPALVMFIGCMWQVNDFLQQNPAAAQFIAISLAIIGTAASAALFISSLMSALSALGLLGFVVEGLAGVMVLTPPILALLVVAGILLYIANQTGLLQKAWKGVAWIQDNALDWLRENIHDLIEKPKMPSEALANLKSIPEILKMLIMNGDKTDRLVDLVRAIAGILGQMILICSPMVYVSAAILRTLINMQGLLGETHQGPKPKESTRTEDAAIAQSAGPHSATSSSSEAADVFGGKVRAGLKISDLTKNDLSKVAGASPNRPAGAVADAGGIDQNPRRDLTALAESYGLDPKAAYTNKATGLSESGKALAIRHRETDNDLSKWTNKATGQPASLPHLDLGGQVTAAGLGVIHEGEQINPARVIRGGETILEKITRTIQNAQGSGVRVQSIERKRIITIDETVHVRSISSEAELDAYMREGFGKLEKRIMQVSRKAGST